MKLKLEDIVWGKRQWELLRVGGVWMLPAICGVMKKTERGFSLWVLMPYSEIAGAAKLGFDVPESEDALLDWQRKNFNMIKEHFEAAGLDFDDPQKLLGDTHEKND